MRPTMESLLPLRQQAPDAEIPKALEGVCVVSGKLDAVGPVDADLVLSGGILLRAEKVWLSGRFQPTHAWKWRKIAERASQADREKWPTWDGISDGDVITRGHIAALKEGGWL